MEYKKFKVTAVNLDTKKSVTITADMQKLSKCHTQEAVKKALEQQILESKIFTKEDLPKLKYQGRKEVLDEWKTNVSLPSPHLDIIDVPTSSNFDLERFLKAQEYNYQYALKEIQNGRKRGHWIWYIFPQQKGLGRSYNSEYYGLDGLDEAKDYLQHPVLGMRLREICQALLDNKGKNIHFIMGSDIDVIKLKTSMQLFELISPNDIFSEVLRTFY